MPNRFLADHLLEQRAVIAFGSRRVERADVLGDAEQFSHRCRVLADRLRKFLHDNYSHVLKEFVADFARFLPHLDKQELYWRLDIVSGALTYAMADFGVIKRRGVSEQQHRDLAATHLIKFAAAGLKAES